MKHVSFFATCLGALSLPLQVLYGQERNEASELPGDMMLAEYFEAETTKLEDLCLSDIRTKEQWLEERDSYRKQMLEMLSLDPFRRGLP